MSTESAEVQQVAGQQIAIDGYWDRLSDEVAESILAHVPVINLVKLRSVNNQWNTLIRSPQFGKLCREARRAQPWMFVYGTNFLLPSKNQSFAYDPEGNVWYTLSSRCGPPAGYCVSTLAEGVGGIVFAMFSGGEDYKICYSSNLVKKQWMHTSDLSVSRLAPLVGFMEDQGSGSGSAKGDKIVAIGGVEIDEDDELVTEIYDTQVGKWRMAKRLPEEFRGNGSRHWLSGAVWQHYLFVLQIHSGTVSSFDLATESWGSVKIMRPLTPSGVKYAYLLICSGQLILAGVCHPPDGSLAFKMWAVNEKTMECKEMGSMPEEHLSMFAKEDDGDKSCLGVRCAARDSIIYVYKFGPEGENQAVFCDISKGWNAWKKVPPMPLEGFRFDTMVGFCSTVNMDSFS